jgi:hypothetical protein
MVGPVAISGLDRSTEVSKRIASGGSTSPSVIATVGRRTRNQLFEEISKGGSPWEKADSLLILRRAAATRALTRLTASR